MIIQSGSYYSATAETAAEIAAAEALKPGSAFKTCN